MSRDHIGRYRIEARIGRGGMGEVHRAYDERLGRWVALKCVQSDKALTPERRLRLEREARTAASLSHPAIAQLHDVLTVDDRDYLVFELVEGKTLAQLLRTDELDLDSRLRIGLAIAQGLAAAHERGVIHRDLKAENVMVTPAGQAKILDFGLAKLTSPADGLVSDSGVMIGTLSAMSPEQAEGRELDARSDLFSLGSLLYQIATGSHPFRTSSPPATLQRILSHRPPPAYTLAPELPAVVSDLIDSLLEKDPSRRPASAQVVAEVLRAVLEPSLSSTGAQSGWLRARNRRRQGMLVGAVAVLVALAAVSWSTLGHRLRPVKALHVAVVQPQLGTDSPELALIADGTLIATLNALAGLEQVFPIDASASEGGSVGTDPQGIAREYAADELVLPTLRATEQTIIATLRRVDGSGGHVLWADHFEVPGDDLRLLSDTVAAHVSRGFAERRPRQGTVAESARPEDLAAFLELRRRTRGYPADVDLPKALDELTQLRRSSPTLLDAYALESRIARYLYQSTTDKRYLDRGVEAVRAAQRIAPDDPRPLRAAADFALGTNDLTAAESVLARLMSIDPANPECLLMQAMLAEKKGRADEALTLLRSLTSTRPAASYLRALASCAQLQGHIDEARSALERAREVAPDSLTVLANLAELELLNGPPQRAEELYLELIAKRPRLHYIINLGTSQLLAGHYEDAITSFRRVIESGSDHPVSLLGLADAYVLTGRTAEAHKLYSAVVDRVRALDTPPDAGMLGIVGQALAHIGMDVEAVAAIQEALRLEPDSPETAFDAALVFSLVGDRASAAANQQRAIRLGVNPHWFALPWFASGQPAP